MQRSGHGGTSVVRLVWLGRHYSNTLEACKRVFDTNIRHLLSPIASRAINGERTIIKCVRTHQNACARTYLTSTSAFVNMKPVMKGLFTKIESAAWGGLVSTHARLFRRIEDDLRRRSGITHAEFEVLLRLVRAPGSRARIQDLAAGSLLTRSGTSRLVDRLVSAGFVERAGAEEDGRGAYAVLTQEGREHFLDAARHHVALVRKTFLGHFSREELEQMATFWARIEGSETADDDNRSTKRPARKPAAKKPLAKKPGKKR